MIKVGILSGFEPSKLTERLVRISAGYFIFDRSNFPQKQNCGRIVEENGYF